MKSLSVLLLLAAPAAGLLPFNATAVMRSPCWDVYRRVYNGSVDWQAKRECESIAGCTFVEESWTPCAPTEFMETIEPGACSNYVVNGQMDYWRSQSQGWGYRSDTDGCEWTNCLKNREALCPQQVPDWEKPDDRKCAWHNGKCQQSSLTDDLIDEKAELLAEVGRSDAVALHRCTVDAMRENGLTAGRSDFGCGPSVLSPDCLTQVTAMGNHAVSCAKETLRSSVEEYYDVNLRWEVESTKELYDCVSEGVQQCPFSQREFCSSVRHPQDWEIPSIADARACVADFNCMVPHYNECARKAEFVIEKALPVVRLSTGYQRAVNTQACLQRAVTTCGSSLQDVIDACLEFTNVEACGANLRCYIAELGACGVENNLWDQDTADDMRRVGPTITGNAKCFARELQGCGFHERGGFCSNGRMRDFADVGACLADFACMAKAIAPCQAGQELLFVAAREVGGRGCKYVDEACEAYCSEHVTSSQHNKDKCILYCRMDGYMQCTLLQRRNTYMTWRYRYVNGSGTYTHEAVVSDEAKQIACFEQSAPACGFDEDTFCEMAGAVPTDAEAEACTVQTKCAAKTLWTCLDRSRSSVVRALDKMADAAVTTYDKYPGLARATRACIEDKEALCGAKMSSLGYNTALCLADRAACEERARCITREAHACGVQSGLLQSATQDLMDSTGYTRCMLAAPAFQGVDLAQKIADLDYDFFFSPSQNLMRAHAKCAGWPLSKLTTILPSFAADPARRQIGSAQFCARSLASICEPFGFDAAAAAACALLATYRCRDGSEFNKKVDGCFADAAGECGAVKGLKTWANVQGVDCVNDVVKCAEMAVCLTAKTSTCLGTFLGGQAYGKLEQASSWTTDITEKYLGWGKKASVPSGGGGGDGGSTAGDGSSTGGDGDSTGGDGGSTGGDGGSAGGDGGSTGGDGGSTGGDGGSTGGDGGSTGGDGGSTGGDGGSTGGDGGSTGGDGGSTGGDGGSTGGDGGSTGGDGGSAGGDGGSTGGDGGSTGGDGGSTGGDGGSTGGDGGSTGGDGGSTGGDGGSTGGDGGSTGGDGGSTGGDGGSAGGDGGSTGGDGGSTGGDGGSTGGDGGSTGGDGGSTGGDGGSAGGDGSTGGDGGSAGGDGGSTGGDGGSTGGDGGSAGGDGGSTGGDGGSTGGDGGSAGGDGGSTGGDGGSTGGDGGSAGGDGGSTGGDGGSTGGDGGSAGGDGGSTGGDGGSAGGDGGSTGGDGGSTGGDGGSAGGDGGSTGGDGGSAGGDGGSTGGDGGSAGGDGGSAGDTPLSGGSGDGSSGSTTSSGGSDGGSAAAADIGSGSMGGSTSGSTSGSGSGSGDGNAHKNAAPSEDKSSSTNLWIVVAAAGGGAIVAALVAVLIVKARAKKAAPQWDTTMCTEEINVRDYEIPMIEEADTLDAQASTHVETDRLTVAAVAE